MSTTSSQGYSKASFFKAGGDLVDLRTHFQLKYTFLDINTNFPLSFLQFVLAEEN